MNHSEEVVPVSIPGYDFGTQKSAKSPVSEADLLHLEMTAGWTNEDRDVLDRHVDLFIDKAEAMVDSWRAVIGSRPHLALWYSEFQNPDPRKAKITLSNLLRLTSTSATRNVWSAALPRAKNEIGVLVCAIVFGLC